MKAQYLTGKSILFTLYAVPNHRFLHVNFQKMCEGFLVIAHVIRISMTI